MMRFNVTFSVILETDIQVPNRFPQCKFHLLDYFVTY